jgi:hypothetical protein
MRAKRDRESAKARGFLERFSAADRGEYRQAAGF